jgi:hypothetical protein
LELCPEPVGSFGYLAGKTSKRDAMTNFADPGDVQIDRTHNAAIRREIGDVLRISLNAERRPLTPTLLDLLDRMAAQDRQGERSKQH